MDSILQPLKRLIPRTLFSALQPTYHYLLALFGALIYRFPGRKLTVIAVTGTKGKSTTSELLFRALSTAGYNAALVSTIHFMIGEEEEKNLLKMTTPGRFFIQKFLRRAVRAGCQYVVLEISSEAAKQFRHKFLFLDALIVTNLSPEHLESHGSFEAYKQAKLSIRDELLASSKNRKVLVVNKDDDYAGEFLECVGVEKATYSMKDAQPSNSNERGSLITFRGTTIHTPLIGDFNIMNALAVLTYAEKAGVNISAVKGSLEHAKIVKGRVEPISVGQSFSVYVDYAHTADSLQKLYTAFKGRRKICVLGSCGGGRDKWKRPEMAKVADTNCDEVFLTNEDPYDEDPMQIIEDMKAGFVHNTPTVVLDRRSAIREALKSARGKDVVLITGKGTDPYIMEANNKKTPWSDALVAEEELIILHKEPHTA